MFRIWKRQKLVNQPVRYHSDILVNEPRNSWSNFGIKVLDYTYEPDRLLKDRKSFNKDKPVFINVMGYVAGLESYMEREGKYFQYHGIITLGIDFPLYFNSFKEREEIKDLKFHKLLLESAKSFPVNMIGLFYENETIPYYINPLVLRMGDYVSPKPGVKYKPDVSPISR